MTVPQGVTPSDLGPGSLSETGQGLESLRRLGKRLGPYAPLLSLIALCVLLALLSPRFLSLRNFVGIANEAAPLLAIAMGTTFVIILGGIDLSVEGIVAVCGVTIVLLAKNDLNGNDYGWLGVAAALLLTGAMGFVN